LTVIGIEEKEVGMMRWRRWLVAWLARHEACESRALRLPAGRVVIIEQLIDGWPDVGYRESDAADSSPAAAHTHAAAAIAIGPPKKNIRHTAKSPTQVANTVAARGIAARGSRPAIVAVCHATIASATCRTLIVMANPR
jgi:hypothetical protein